MTLSSAHADRAAATHRLAPSPAAPAAEARLQSALERAGLWLAVAIVVFAFGLPLFEGLGHTDLKGDEPIYAFAVDRILETGDWLTPRSIPSDTTAFLEKPPLKFWIAAAAIRTGLVTNDEYGHRVTDAAFGLLAFIYVFALGRLAGGAVCGLVAVLVLFVHRPLIFEHGLRSSNMEAALVLSYCGGMFHAVAWSRAGGGRRWLHALACAGWFYLGFMTKFVAAFFLPAILVVTGLLFRQWRRRLAEDWRVWLTAVLLFAAAAAPWFIYQAGAHGRDFWDIIFGQHVYVRFTAHLDPAHLQPWHYYFDHLYREMSRSHFVWGETSLLVIAGLVVVTVRTLRRRWDVGALLLLWFTLPLAAISSGTSKVYHYIYPFLPPLAIAAGMVPAVLLEPGSVVRTRLRAALDWLGATRPARRLQTGTPWARRAVVTVAVLALAVAAATVALQQVRVSVGDVLLFRNSSTVRPMLIGALLLTLAGHGRLVAGALLVPLLLLALPLTSYREVREELPRVDQQLRAMRACVAGVQRSGAAPHGIYSHTQRSLPWDYVYYFREVGFDETGPKDDAVLTAHLLTPGEQRPVLIHDEEFAAYLARQSAEPARAEAIGTVAKRPMFYGQLFLLPGPYAPCARPAVPGRPR